MRHVIFILVAGLALVSIESVAQSPGPTDPQIAAIVVTAVDINAEKEAHNQQVKDFAKQMVIDHTGVNKAASDLVTKLKVTPEDNATSASLKKGGEANIEHLEGLRGAAR